MTAETVARLQAALAHRFVIDREVGGGGMGVVFQAREKDLGRQVAIKMLSPEVVARLGIKSFRREIKYTARLQHPHILPLLEAGDVDGQLYYVMPFVRGGSLRDVMKSDGALPLNKTLRVVKEIGSALDYAHTHRIVHCDIKPENVLFSAGYAVLADFGIARNIEREPGIWRKNDYESLGSPIYMSPEQASGEDDLDERSDVYSLACVIHEMLAGEPPFTGDSVEAVIAKRFTETPPLLTTYRNDIPLSAARAIRKALELDPRDRFPSMAKFVRALIGGSRTKRARGEAGEPKRGVLGRLKHLVGRKTDISLGLTGSLTNVR